MEWAQIFLGSTVIVGLIALAGKLLGWKFSPQEKADVRKVESGIRVDDAGIISRKLDDEIKISNEAKEWAGVFRAALDKANDQNDKLQRELEKLRALNDKQREDHNRKIDELEIELKEGKKYIEWLTDELVKFKKKYEDES